MRKLVVIIGLFLLLAGCADTVTFAQAANMAPVGFIHGLWHGLIFGFAWFFSLFVDSISMYAIYNNGGWYDFGFFIGISLSFGGTTTKVIKR